MAENIIYVWQLDKSTEEMFIPASEAVGKLTDEYIDDGMYSAQTVLDLRDCLKSSLERITELETLMKEFRNTFEKAGDYHDQLAAAYNFHQKICETLEDEEECQEK